MEKEIKDPFMLGWKHGFNEQLPNNPYPKDSLEFKEYERGFKQGSDDR